MEAFEGYWRKMPSVKRLVYKSVPEATTRLAMLKRGEVDLAYLLEVPLAEEVKRDPKLKLAFSGGIGTIYIDFFDMWDPKSPWADQRVRLAASLALDRQALNEAETLGASPAHRQLVPKSFEFALPIEPHPYDPARAKKLLAEAGYPNGFDAGDCIPGRPISRWRGGHQLSRRGGHQDARCAPWSAPPSMPRWRAKKLRGSACASPRSTAMPPSRLSEIVPAEGAFAYGGCPDIDALYKQQAARPTEEREAMLQRIQQTLFDRVRFAPSTTISGRAASGRGWPSRRSC